ncbi:MAG: tripartite tricarboxylate transporter family receptor [Clostridiales bacterium]|jgi:putative tricarboxylic transport membrane protein|nr:tripartite tricarboxylate transporter family receptor [Clostridiales bacterium]
MSSFKITADRVLGITSVLLGLVSILESVRLYPIKTSPMVGDHTLPALIGSLLVICGLLLTFFIKIKAIKVDFPDKSVRMKMIYSMILMFIYLVLIQFLGYLIATFMIYTGLFKLFGSYKWLKCTIISVIATIICYFVFVQWLGMPFPSGILNI